MTADYSKPSLLKGNLANPLRKPIFPTCTPRSESRGSEPLWSDSGGCYVLLGHNRCHHPAACSREAQACGGHLCKSLRGVPRQKVQRARCRQEGGVKTHGRPIRLRVRNQMEDQMAQEGRRAFVVVGEQPAMRRMQAGTLQGDPSAG